MSGKIVILMIFGMAMTLYAVEGSEVFKRRNTLQRESTEIPPMHNKHPVERRNILLSPPPLVSSTAVPKIEVEKSVSSVASVDAPVTRSDFAATLNLNEYIGLVLHDGSDRSNGSYDAKLQELQGLIDQSRYDFILSFQALVSASQLPTPTEGLGTTLSGRAGIQANKILYDGNRHFYLNEHTTLIERFAKVKKLSIQEQMKLYSAELYLRLLELQGRKNYLKKYQDLNDNVYRMTMQKHEHGVNDNAYNQINAKIDQLALEKLVLGLQYDLYSATVSFKQAANMVPNRDIALDWPNIDMPTASVEMLQQSAIEKNSQVKLADTLFRLKKGEVQGERGKNEWEVNFNGFAGAGYSNTATNLTTSKSTGPNWIVSLQATHPINPHNLDLAVEKKMVEALREKSNLTLTQEAIVARVNKLFVECKRENQMLQLLSVQKELMERHLKITKYRLEGGLEPYSSYAASMKKMIEVEEEILSGQIRQARNRFELQLLSDDSQ